MDACECDEEEQQRTHIEICDVRNNETKHTLITNEEEQQTHIEIHEELKFETEPCTLVTDEEEQKNLGHLREEVQELRIKNEHTQREIQTIKRILRQEVDTSKSSHFNILNDMRYLRNRLRILEESKIEMQDDIQQLKEHNNRLRILEEAKIEMQDDIQQLKEHNNAANISISSSLPQRLPIAMPSILMRNVTTSDDGLPLDTFTLLMISRVRSIAWVLGILTFALQMTLIMMIGISQIKDSVQSSLFDVPFKVDGVVRAGQLLTIVYTIATQNDIITSVRFLIMFWRDPRWDQALLRRHEGAPPPTNALRVVHILLPNGLKFMLGLLVIGITFVVIVQSDNIIDLLKDFTALMAMSETDNISFWLAVNGYLGSELQQKTIEARDIDIRDEVTATYTNINRGPTNTSIRSRTSDENDGGFVTRSIILLAIGMAMLGGWLCIVINQVNGTYFHQRYPYCKPPKDQPEIDMFVLAKEHFADEVCYGGPLNTLGCQFEGGDCANFNQALPLCKGDDLVDVQKKVGNGECDPEFNTIECNYDGGDCPFETRYPNCTHIKLAKEHFGDGVCYGGPLNTLECEFEGGDCANFNAAYPLCKGDNLVNVQNEVGNGECNDTFDIPECNFDGGDCPFETRYPNCPHIDLAKKHFGDGVCYGGPLNTLGCQFEGGDCISFNLALPLCKGDNRTDVQTRVGDGNCEKVFMSSDCDYDGGDCCPYKIINGPSFGDGICDEKANFEECGYDDGDCVDYNRDYSGCPLDVVFGNALFGDGQWCNGGIASTKNCSYDDGDCNDFRISYPNCPLDDLSLVEGADDVVIGDGTCDSDIYNSEDCGYENGDCCPPSVLSDPRLGNGQCDGGFFNTKPCSNDDGDCDDFILAFPRCPLDDLSRVEGADDVVIGDGTCDSDIYNSEDCGYENGDCCPPSVLSDPRLGNGQCDGGIFNTKPCSNDDGDCSDFILAFPKCPLDDLSRVEGADDVVIGDGTCDSDIYNSEDCGYENGDCCPPAVLSDPRLGNGQCDGGFFNSEQCSHDDGDCDDFILAFPKCPLDDLSRVEGADDVVIGDGICDGIYNLEECGYEFGDCNYGQVGSTVSITDHIEGDGELYFSKVLSLDGMTMTLGLSRTDEDGTFDFNAPGLVKIWRYNSIRKMWLQLGNDIIGQQDNDEIGHRMSVSANGNRLMISSRSELRFYDFNVTSDDWIQVGQAIISSLDDSFGAMTSDGSKVALLYSEDEIRIYDVDEASTFDVIEPVVDLSDDQIQLTFNAKDGSRLLLRDGGVTKIYRFNPDDTPKSWTQIGQDIESLSYSLFSSAMSADGNRIAVSSNVTSTNTPGQVDVYDYDVVDNAWVAVGNSIKSRSSSNDDGFGYDIKLSSDGNLLVIAFNGPGCKPHQDIFDIDKCTTGSIAVYNFDPSYYQFQKVIPNSASPFKVNGNVLNLADLLSDSAIFGLHFSMNGDGSVLSMSGFNLDDRSVFVETYNLNEFFYTKCVVNEPDVIGDGYCNDLSPYNSEKCGFDGGDCERNPVEGYPDCFVHYTYEIGDGYCAERQPYNTEECGFDGGDCEQNPVEGYPDCFVHLPDRIGDGYCHDWPPYNSEQCGFDGGDCVLKPVEGYLNCFVLYPDKIGDGRCHDFPPYNSEECGFDGGDCLE